MRIAILILAHKSPVMVNRLVNRLADSFDVYIHADRRFAYEPPDRPNVTLVSPRYASDWGSWKQIAATLALFRAASERKYDRYVLISGQDVPIESNEGLIEFFSRYPETDFIAHFKRETEEARLADERKLTLIWVARNRIKSQNKALDSARRICSKALFLAESGVQFAQRTFRLYRRLPCPVWGGENWVNLTGRTMDAFLAFIDDNPSFLRSFRHTKSGDEMIVQMALLEFVRPSSVMNTSLRYVDFVSGPEDPRILRIEDYRKIVSSGMLFARKADDFVDGKVIEMLYSRSSPGANGPRDKTS